MKKKLLRRIVLTYILFCVIGFIGTSYFISKNHVSLLRLTFTPADLKQYFLTGYFFIYLIACAAALVILFVYAFSVYHPLRHIVQEAVRYAEGDYETPISTHSNDELGFIVNVMNCMARELYTLEDDQRKFVSNVSHDFRSPLTSIKGYAEAIADGTIPSELQEKYLTVIVSETERLEKLTQSLLDLNKYSAKGAYMNFSTFDINELIMKTMPAFEGRSMDKNVRFNLGLTEHPIYVSADADKINQVLHNLIDNALKFSYDDSEIVIETNIKNGKAFVSVRDFGIGIPKDSLNKIWERFYKIDTSRGKNKNGTGLGLAIVKEIIHAHHENINVISTEGVGTEFIFSLSLAALPPA